MAKNYVVVSSDNEWLSTLTDVEPKDLQEEMSYIVLEMDVKEDVEVFAYEYVGEPIKFN